MKTFFKNCGNKLIAFLLLANILFSNVTMTTMVADTEYPVSPTGIVQDEEIT